MFSTARLAVEACLKEHHGKLITASIVADKAWIIQKRSYSRATIEKWLKRLCDTYSPGVYIERQKKTVTQLTI